MRNWLTFILFLVLAGIAIYLYINDGEVTLKEDYSDFAIEDTSKVDQIFISNLDGKKVLLTRREGGLWKVEGKYIARPDAIQLILKTLHDIKVQAPVSESRMDLVIRRMAATSTKVEFYTGGNTPTKVWYIGDPTASKVGTYMLLEKQGIKSSRPYVTHLLMEKGSLGSRFFLDNVLWRDRVMLKTNPQKIRSIEVFHSTDTSTSFRIEQTGNAQFKVTNLENNTSQLVPANIAIPYFKNFKGVYYEYMDMKTPKSVLDSIYALIPRHKISVTDESGQLAVFKTYNMPVREGATLPNGEPIDFNPERMYAFSSELGADVHVVVQNYTFDKLAPSFEHFTQSTTVDK